MPTPVPITPPTVTEVMSTAVSVVQNFGLIPFIMFAGFASAAYFLYRRMKSASR